MFNKLGALSLSLVIMATLSGCDSKSSVEKNQKPEETVEVQEVAQNAEHTEETPKF